MDAKEDLFNLLEANEDRYNALRRAIVEGRINGLWPSLSLFSKCGCIKAHLMVTPMQYPGTPIEQFVLNIRPGETPATSPALKTILSWLDEWVNSRGCEF